MYIYLYLNLFTIFFPLLLSFDKRVQFYKKWKYLFPAMLITGIFFVSWDVLFTQNGVWGFNPEYLTGIYFMGLPLEEILFFVTVPYACVFIYETLNAYLTKDYLNRFSSVITVLLLVFLLFTAAFNLPQLYTSITFFLLILALIVHYFLFKKEVIGRFYLAYLVHLLPFLLVNGVLTYLPIVWYNNSYNLGIRIVSIPVEDTMYSMLMLLMTITIFEAFRRKDIKKQNRPVMVK
ncbi:MAG: lycopene cyclase domain-containing protein [Hymenobacteraceae bacterium]|nr:lycopene cyclase domain-containing protein [Hymenobacteraceae bacterium]MDX5396490.1 lycopene cyclase domain-containing protein [Hymenobacteraceae bacterium]MDX5442468.1 lycopene cyclase domain-containing protein [Hymenobacteraceae bacterium]MDX5512548.1 lycopene cyclase domain-containing protein [Hymenobacteraceae bacterium]